MQMYKIAAIRLSRLEGVGTNSDTVRKLVEFSNQIKLTRKHVALCECEYVYRDIELTRLGAVS